ISVLIYFYNSALIARQFAKQFLLNLVSRKTRDIILLYLPPFVIRLFFRTVVEIFIPTILRSITIARRFGILLFRGRENNIYVEIRPAFKRNQLRFNFFKILLWRFQINQKIFRELNIWFPGVSDILTVLLP
ncbi:hypothetical protein PoMZ_13522, partial [Pyricularia oryzae]